LGDYDTYVRDAAAYALGYIGEERARKPLKQLLKTGDKQLHGTATLALAMMDENMDSSEIEE
jgi:HEAT repeat protein